jgi:hypothetical protein
MNIIIAAMSTLPAAVPELTRSENTENTDNDSKQSHTEGTDAIR